MRSNNKLIQEKHDNDSDKFLSFIRRLTSFNNTIDTSRREEKVSINRLTFVRLPPVVLR
jgi:hypothetical protein